MRPVTARRWVEGYNYRHRGERRHSDGVPYLADSYATALEHDNPTGPGRGDAPPVLDFEQLLTLLLVHAFHERGLSLPKIEQAARRAKELYGVENPFITKRFRTDGNKVFIDLDPASRGKERQLIDVLPHQREFREIVEPSLFRDVVFAGDRAGEWWPLGRQHAVLVSPSWQFGVPHIARTGIRTDVAAEMAAAEGGGDAGARAAAEWFGLKPEQVRDAVRFEEWLRQTS